MAVSDAHVFPCFLTPVLTQLFFPKPPTTSLTCFCRGERQKYARQKIRLNRDRTHNHQVMSLTRSPLSHPSGGGLLLTLCHTMTPFDGSGKKAFWKHCGKRRNCLYKQFLLFPQCFLHYQRQKWSRLLHLMCCLQMLPIWPGPIFCRVVKEASFSRIWLMPFEM